MTYQYTSQADLRKSFWILHPEFKKLVGGHNAQSANARLTFADWIDALARACEISDALAQRATL